MLFSCTVSRSHEEAANDQEWPGKPVQNLKQTNISTYMIAKSADQQMGSEMCDAYEQCTQPARSRSQSVPSRRPASPDSDRQ